MDILAANALGAFFGHWIWPIFLFVFGLGAVVFVHELGHFLVAKAVGIKVERFALGFGPRLFGIKVGETDYSIMLLPLGGYVKMLGQEDFKPLEGEDQLDPRSFAAKTVGQRFAVISAGVVMNVIFAAIVFVIIGMVGKSFPAAVVGGTVQGMPASQAQVVFDDQPEVKLKGLQAGDRITGVEGNGLLLKILGTDVTRFSKIAMLGALSDTDDVYEFTIERPTNGESRIGKAKVGLSLGLSPSGTGALLPQFGLIPAHSLTLSGVEDYITQDSFQEGDEVLAVNGQKVKHSWDIYPLTESLFDKKATVTVLRDGKEHKIEVEPEIWSSGKAIHLKDGTLIRDNIISVDYAENTFTIQSADGTKREIKKDDKADSNLLDVLGMHPRVSIGAVSEGSPAEDAGLKPGDVIVSYGDQSAPSHQQILDLNKKLVGSEAKMTVLRDGKYHETEIVPKSRKSTVQIGIINSVDRNLVVAGIRKNSPAAKAGILAGDVIQKVNDTPVNTWQQLVVALDARKDQDITLTAQRGTSTVEAKFGKLGEQFALADFSTVVFQSPRSFTPLMGPKVKHGPLGALAWGGNETLAFLATNYATIRSLIAGTVETKELSGPVGIGSLAIKTGRRSLSDFFYFMGMISIGLAVVNFLPFPVVDGGHALFLVIEKLRGKPLSLRVMNIVQMIGLATILVVFIALTWQDIARLVSQMW